MDNGNNKPTPKVRVEFKHATYVEAQDGSNNDALVIKERHHHPDGSWTPHIRVVENYKRPFYITMEGRRNHKDKKDYEFVSSTRKYSCKQIELRKQIVNILRDFSAGPNPPLRRACDSPYVYGADISSSALMKREIKMMNPNLISLNRVAGGDIETNVLTKEEEIILMSVTSKKNGVVAILKSWIGDEIDGLEEKIHACIQEYFGELFNKREMDLEIVVCDTPADVALACLMRLHKWKPDFLTFWNMDFDISRISKALAKEGIDLANAFSDPSVPSKYKVYDYTQAQKQKVTASGKTSSVNIEDQWHWLRHAASFQIIDAMTVYRLLRLAAGKDSSYALDYILQKEIKLTKLKHPPTQHLSGLRWHEIMQDKFKIVYIAYNIFDSLALELLDEKTNDLSSSITSSCKSSDYRNLNSNPRRLCDDMHFFYLDQKVPKVIGTSGSNMVHPVDQFVIGHDNWINASM